MTKKALNQKLMNFCFAKWPIHIKTKPIEFQKKILARPEGEIRARRTDSTSSRISIDNATQNLFLKDYISVVRPQAAR